MAVDAGATEATKVLIVDDDEDLCRTMQRLLSLQDPDLDIQMASDARTALELLAATKVDILVVDYRMPGMDGLEFLAKAREVAPSSVPIMCTAYPSMELTLRALKEGQVRFFLVKPVGDDGLVDAIATIRDEQG